MSTLGTIAFILVVGTAARWFWRAYRVDIPVSAARFQALWAAGLVLAAIALTGADSGALAPWALGLAALFLYLSSTGRQRIGTEAIEVGATIPAFSLADDRGETFDSAELAGSRVLLKFFRGHW